MFDLLGNNVEFFLFRESGMVEIALYALIIAFVFPLVLYSVSRILSAASRTVGIAVFGFWVLLFAILFFAVLAKTAGLSSSSFTTVGIMLAGVALGFAYLRSKTVQSLVGYMAIIAIVAPALFLWRNNEALNASSAIGPQTVPVASPETPVFVLVFDELPLSSLLDANDGIDAYRYPSFGRLASTSTWYKNASTVSDSTMLAIPAILTGKRPTPSAEGAAVSATSANYPNTLFTLLSHTHRVHATESITLLCPDSVCKNSDEPSTLSRSTKITSAMTDTAIVYLHQIVPDELAKHLPPINSNWGGFGGDAEDFDWDGLFFNSRIVKDALEKVKSAAPGDVHFIHLNMPHHPWIHYPSGKRYRSSYLAKGVNPRGIEWFYANGHLWGHDEDSLEVSRQRQSMQIAYSDKILGQFLAAIDSSGLFQDGLIIVTADHGSNIERGELMRWATENNVDDLMSIPLFIKYPSQITSEVDALNAETVDVLPTVIDVLGVEVDWKTDGHTLRDLASKPTQGKTIMRTIPATSTEENRAKGYLLGARDYNIFSRIWRDEPARWSTPAFKQYPFDRSHNPMLLGQHSDSLKAKASGRIATVTGMRRLDSVNLKKRVLPGYMLINIEKQSDEETFSVVVSVNDVIQVVRFVNEGNPGEVEVVLPEHAISQGRNRLGVYISSKSGKGYEKLELQNQRFGL